MKTRMMISLMMLLMISLMVTGTSYAQRCVDATGAPIPCPTSVPSDPDDPAPEPTRNPDEIPPDSDGDGTADPLDACPAQPGDGNNRGCPEGVDPNNPVSSEDTSTSQQEVAVQLLPAPPSDECIVSPDGSFGVNMRLEPNPDAPISHILQVNEWAIVLVATYEGDDPFRAETEPGANETQLGINMPDLDPTPDPTPDPNDPDDDPQTIPMFFYPQAEDDETPPIWLFVRTSDNFLGWVLMDLMRFGGDCADLVLPGSNPNVMWLQVFEVPGGGATFPSGFPFLHFPVDPDPGPDFEILFPDNPTGPGAGTAFFAPGCELYSPEAGVYILICDHDAPQPVVEGMSNVLPQGCELVNPEAGVFVLICPPEASSGPVTPDLPSDALPQGCELFNPEGGVFILICDEDVDPDPVVEGMSNVLPQGCEWVNPEAGVFYLDCMPESQTTYSPANNGFDFAPACMVVEQVTGVFVLECAGEDQPTITYCVIEPGAEAGMWVEVCYEIEVPDGCVLDTAEAGVWKLECEEDTGIGVTPFGDTDQILSVDNSGSRVLIGLLLPAVQKVREAAGR